MELENRFMNFVEKTNECWIWKGSKDKRGYGRFSIEGKPWLAHRVSYCIFKEFPTMELLHSCDNQSCVNPDHLSEGTHLQNMRDAQNRGLMKQPGLKGSKHSQSVLTEEQVLQIRRDFSEGKSGNYVAKKYFISRSNAYFIRDKKTWTHI